LKGMGVKTAASQKPGAMRYSEKTIQRIYLLISSSPFAGLLRRSDLELGTIHGYPWQTNGYAKKAIFGDEKGKRGLVRYSEYQNLIQLMSVIACPRILSLRKCR
jgi:hypothetical protein